MNNCTVKISPETVDFTFSPDQYDYNIYTDYTVSSLKVIVTADSAVKINGTDVETGTETEIFLNIGYTQIDICLSGSEETHYYIHVHRENDPAVLYNETFRSQVHISTKDCLLNDPNGLMYDAYSDEYHLFCQYSPKTSYETEDKAWCHFVSKNLVHWEELGIALTTDELGEAWSGSGVIDRDNSTGLFDESVPPDSRMVLIYTSAKGDTKYGTQKISLAYSNDFGRTWIKYEGNPVIKNGDNYQEAYSGGFRDPKIFWYEEENLWVAVIGGGPFRLFTSTDLIHWTQEGQCYDTTGKRVINAECPDLFKISVEGTGETRWVAVGSDFNNGDSKILYYVGNLSRDENGELSFVATQKRKDLFEGGTVYSTQTFYNDKLGRRISASWVREWWFIEGTEGAGVKNWAGLISWPLELKLTQNAGEYVLKSCPVSEMETLRDKILFETTDIDVTPQSENILSGINGEVFELTATLSDISGSDFEFSLRNIKYTYSCTGKTLTVDASKVQGGTRTINVNLASDESLTLRIIVDKANTAIYINNGDSSDYVIAYPETSDMSLTVTSGTVHVEELKVYSLESIWTEKQDAEAMSGKTARKSASKLLITLICLLSAGLLVLTGFIIKSFIPKKKVK